MWSVMTAVDVTLGGIADNCRSAPDFHIGTIGFETARKRILALSIPVVIVAATAAILLSLPHCL